MCVVWGLPSCGGYNVVTVLCNAGLHRAMTGGGWWRDWHRPCFLDITVITAIISLLSQPRTTGAQRQQIGLLHRYAFSIHFRQGGLAVWFKPGFFEKDPLSLRIILRVYYYYNFIEALPLMCWVYSTVSTVSTHILVTNLFQTLHLVKCAKCPGH